MACDHGESYRSVAYGIFTTQKLECSQWLAEGCPSTASKCKKRWETTISGVSGVRHPTGSPVTFLAGAAAKRPPIPRRAPLPMSAARRGQATRLRRRPKTVPHPRAGAPDHQGADERSDRTNRPASGLRPAARSQTGRKPVKRHGLPPRKARSLGPEEAAARSYGPYRLFGRHRKGHDIARGLELLHAAIQIVFGQKSASDSYPIQTV